MSKKFFIQFTLTSLAIVSLLFFSACGKKMENSDAALKASVDTALTNGDWSEAQTYAEMALKADNNNIDAQVMYAISQDKLGKREDAIKTLRNIVFGNPNNFLAQLSLGEMLYKNQNYEEAYENLGNAYNLNNDNIDTLVLYSQCAGKLLAKNTPALYLKLAQTKQFADKPEVYNNLATYYLSLKDYNSALKNFLKAYRLADKNPTIVANLGIFRDKYMSDKKQAKYFYRKFITLTIGNSAFDSQREYFSKRLRELKS
ncbi:MAG TPA: hypothetical protein DD381_08615 [Lentisphaeria bacterium]|nr:MAG: hypothetical protein A2X47_08230 [Lentisphaerae bacterium GWF2_38_69]HBM16385.1 hypothetical protein [Lentisphaeria bacterium]